MGLFETILQREAKGFITGDSWKGGTPLSELDPVVIKGCLPPEKCWENALGYVLI